MTARFVAGALPVLAALAGCSSLIGIDNEYIEEGVSQGAGGAGGAGGNGSSACTPGDVRSCYSGPSGTAGVGMCREGIQTCGMEGVWGGACLDEVLPGVENCATGEIDEDCDGMTAADLEAGCVCAPGAVDACPTGKLGVCGTGEHICDETGRAFGACTETYNPSFDDCATIADEDCDGMATGCLGTPLFAKSFGVAGNSQQALSAAVDSAGNVIVGGSRAGDLWLVKLSPTGAILWEKIVAVSGQNASVAVRSVAVGAGDEIIVVGDFNGQMDLGGSALNAGVEREIFVAKRNKDGNHVWAKAFGDGAAGSADQSASSVALDASGNIFITGQIEGTSFFGAIQAAANGVDAYVAKLDKDGNAQWVNRGGDSAPQYGAALATTASGDVVVTGGFQGDLGFGGPVISSAGGIDAYLAKLKGSDGILVWSKGLGDATGQVAFDQAGTSVAIDAKGNIDLVGNFRKSIDLSGKALTNSDAVGTFSDIFIAQFDDAGAFIWGQGFGDANTQVPNGLAVDPAGNLLVTGYFRGTFSFGGPDLVSPDTTNQVNNLFVAKLSPAGTHLWSAGYGDTSYQAAWSVATDAKANAFVVGNYEGTINTGAAGSISSVGTRDAFVLGFSP